MTAYKSKYVPFREVSHREFLYMYATIKQYAISGTDLIEDYWSRNYEYGEIITHFSVMRLWLNSNFGKLGRSLW